MVHAYSSFRDLVDGALRAERHLAEKQRIRAGRFGAASGTSSSRGQPSHSQTQSQSTTQFQPSQQRQQQYRGRTRDDAVSSGGAQSSRAPQSGATAPGQGSGGRRDVTCFSCGRQGHTARLCRSVRPATTQSAPLAGGVTCFQCGQQGHVRRSCPQLQSQSHPAGPSTSQQTGVSVTQPP